MKKTILSLVVAIVAATATFAQSSMLATLSHNGEISTFYGATALRDAYNASQHGDIITLSSGSFASVDIEKALTIRGAGMQIDTVAKTYPTIIAGSFSINVPESVENRLTMEGLYNNFTITVKGTLKNASFLKDRFNTINPENASNTRMKNLTFIHCKISGNISLPDESSASCVNCYICEPLCYSGTSSNFEFSNCIITSEYTSRIHSSSFTNCFVRNHHPNWTDDDTRLNASNTAFHCLGMNNGNNMFIYIPNTTNMNLTSALNTAFKTYTGSYDDSEDFKLTDAAKAQYLGSDRTEVGIYGGNLPFNPTPTNPQITKCNVAAKSTADGKLSVDITVGGAE